MIEYAKSELARIKRDDSGMQDLMDKNILEIIEVFEKQGHSGFSAGYLLSRLERLMRFKPITPLTGDDSEWGESHYGSRQNKRCSSVFKDDDGTITDIDAVIVSDNGGITWFQSGRFREKVTMPYLPPVHPKKVYIEYTEDVPVGFSGDKFDVITDDPERIKALYDRKRKEFDSIREG